MSNKQIVDFKNRILVLGFMETHPNYPIDVLEGRTQNWTWEAYVKCMGTGFNN